MAELTKPWELAAGAEKRGVLKEPAVATARLAQPAAGRRLALAAETARQAPAAAGRKLALAAAMQVYIEKVEGRICLWCSVEG